MVGAHALEGPTPYWQPLEDDSVVTAGDRVGRLAWDAEPIADRVDRSRVVARAAAAGRELRDARSGGDCAGAVDPGENAGSWTAGAGIGQPEERAGREMARWSAQGELGSDTRAGVARSLVSPRPSWPSSFRPQAYTVPSSVTATEWP